jgi:hypothetical protein
MVPPRSHGGCSPSEGDHGCPHHRGGYRGLEGIGADQVGGGAHLYPVPDPPTEGAGTRVVVALGDHRPNDGVTLPYLGRVA